LNFYSEGKPVVEDVNSNSSAILLLHLSLAKIVFWHFDVKQVKIEINKNKIPFLAL
jgi:hypothetical protein